MAKTSVILDASALVAYFDPRERDHNWAAECARESPSPWLTCEAALSETFFILQPRYKQQLIELARRDGIRIAFNLANELEPVLALMEKYADVPMSLGDACIVRMTEILSDPVVLTTDSDFRVYRRLGRRVIPCRMP